MDYRNSVLLTCLSGLREGVELSPEVLQHIGECRLPTEACEMCRTCYDDFVSRYGQARKLHPLPPLTLKARLFKLYLDLRYDILWKLWLWGLIADRPKWTI